MKKLAVFALFIVGAVGLSACALNSIGTTAVFDTTEDIYAFSAISSTNLLVSQRSDQNTSVALPLSVEDTPLVELQIDDINKYLNMMEKFLGGDGAYTITQETSDRLEYQFKVTFVAKDILGNDVSYVLYYSEITELVNTPVELDQSDSDNEDDDANESDTEDDANELDNEFEDDFSLSGEGVQLQGLLVVNDVEYIITGKKVVSGDEEKVEIISTMDEANYVKVVSKLEDGERKFNYTVVSEGVITSQSKIKVEEEQNEKKVVLDFISGEDTGHYVFKQETENGQSVIKISYEVLMSGVAESGQIRILVVVDELTGETSYFYYIESEDHLESESHRDRDDDPGQEGEHEDDDESESEDLSL